MSERRKHRRYPLRLAVNLRRGTEMIEAMVINASVGGCLLLVTMPIEVGEKLVLHMPQLRMPEASLHVLRTETSEVDAKAGWLVATCYEAALADEAALAALSRTFGYTEPGDGLAPRVLH
jgi:hypothetical protein